MSRIKRAVCAAVSTAFGMSLLCLSVPQPISAYDSQTESTSSTISRDYRMHQCSSASASSYTPYILTYNSNTLSVPSNTRDYPTDDNRVPDEDSRIVRLCVYNNQNQKQLLGTGFIVDDYTIATAAHCIYDRESDDFLTFVIDLFEDGVLVDTIEPLTLHIPTLYDTAETTDEAELYDYGLITVDEDLYEYGAFHFGVPQDAFMNSNATVAISGFPGCTHQVIINTDMILYKGTGSIVPYSLNVTNGADYQVKCEVYTSAGQSGAPIYFEQSIGSTKYQTVIGILTSGSEGHSTFGTRITFPVLMFYYNNPNL